MGANLSAAKIYGVDFTKASLRNSNLKRANIVGGNFNRASLGEADLTEANISGTNLDLTDLYGANLNGADFVGCSLGQVNLSRLLADYPLTTLTDEYIKFFGLTSQELDSGFSITNVADVNTHHPRGDKNRHKHILKVTRDPEGGTSWRINDNELNLPSDAGKYDVSFRIDKDGNPIVTRDNSALTAVDVSAFTNQQGDSPLDTETNFINQGGMKPTFYRGVVSLMAGLMDPDQTLKDSKIIISDSNGEELKRIAPGGLTAEEKRQYQTFTHFLLTGNESHLDKLYLGRADAEMDTAMRGLPDIRIDAPLATEITIEESPFIEIDEEPNAAKEQATQRQESSSGITETELADQQTRNLDTTPLEVPGNLPATNDAGQVSEAETQGTGDQAGTGKSSWLQIADGKSFSLIIPVDQDVNSDHGAQGIATTNKDAVQDYPEPLNDQFVDDFAAIDKLEADINALAALYEYQGPSEYDRTIAMLNKLLNAEVQVATDPTPLAGEASEQQGQGGTPGNDPEAVLDELLQLFEASDIQEDPNIAALDEPLETKRPDHGPDLSYLSKLQFKPARELQLVDLYGGEDEMQANA